MGFRISVKAHVLHAHLDKFKNKFEAYTEEQKERFRQKSRNFEVPYQGQQNNTVIGDYVWRLIRQNDLKYRQNS